jgi:hypothetical protein
MTGSYEHHSELVYCSACHLLARWFAESVSSTLKMEAISSSKTSGTTQRTTRRHIPEDDTLHNHRYENLKSYIKKFSSFVEMKVACTDVDTNLFSLNRKKLEQTPPEIPILP